MCCAFFIISRPVSTKNTVISDYYINVRYNAFMWNSNESLILSVTMMSIEILAACMKSHILIYSLYFESVRYMHDYTQLLCSLFEYLHPNDDSLIRVCILMSIHSVLLRQHLLFDVWLSLFSCIHHALSVVVSPLFTSFLHSNVASAGLLVRLRNHKPL